MSETLSRTHFPPHSLEAIAGSICGSKFPQAIPEQIELESMPAWHELSRVGPIATNVQMQAKCESATFGRSRSANGDRPATKSLQGGAFGQCWRKSKIVN